MRSFFKSSLWSFVSIGTRTLSALLINKLIALQFGPNGITLLAHFQNLVAIVSTIPNDGINMGLISYLAGKETTDDNYRPYFYAGAFWQCLVFGVVMLVLLTQSDFFLEAFFESGATTHWLIFFLSGILLLLLSIFFQAILLARQQLPWYTCLVALSSLGSALLIWLLLQKYALPQLLLLYLVSQGITALAGFGIIWFKGWLPQNIGEFISKPAFQDIGKFIVMALTLVVCSKLVNFYVRELMISRFDLYQTGLWQAMVKISDNYTMIFTSLLGMVYYPKIAALLATPDQFRIFVRRIFFMFLPLLAIGLGMVYLLQHWIILILFDAAFLPGRYLLDFQILGDFFKMAAWILSYIMLARGQVLFNIVIQVIGAGLYLVMLFWLVNQYGLEGVTMAHALSFGLFFVFNVLYFRKLIF